MAVSQGPFSVKICNSSQKLKFFVSGDPGPLKRLSGGLVIWGGYAYILWVRYGLGSMREGKAEWPE